ncbi:hypothetical protein [Austwickia chelonae]|uniref:hypothetical protein n=1 Tax=Austwickia chelonae TaxID=100225 RepID=UPI000E241EBE|nr:hypothetical protein [Austwickia chelonae]
MRKIRPTLLVSALAAAAALAVGVGTPPAQGASAGSSEVFSGQVSREISYRAMIFQTPAANGAYEGMDVNDLGQLVASQLPHDRQDFIGDSFGRTTWLSREATGCAQELWPDAGRARFIDARGQVVGEGQCTIYHPRAGNWAITRWSSAKAAPALTQHGLVMGGPLTVVATNTAGEVLIRLEGVTLEPMDRVTERGGTRLVDARGKAWSVIGNDLAEDGTVVGRLVTETFPERGVPFATRGSTAVPLVAPPGVESPSADAGAVAVSPNARWIVGGFGPHAVRWDVRRAPGSLPSGFSPVDVNDHGVVLGRAGEGWAVWSPLGGLRSVRLPGLPAGVRVKSMAKINWWGQIAATVTGTDGIDRAALLSPGR